jgi:ABC-type uncharacterized transport system permease subunit
MMLSILTCLLYLVTAASVLRNHSLRIERWSAPFALIAHSVLLWQQIVNGVSLSLGISEALSLFAWQSALLLWFLCLREPLRMMAPVIYPLAGAAALFSHLWPTQADDVLIPDWQARVHILLSLLSAGLLTLAAVHAVLLAIQERLLHDHRLNTLASRLPPILTMERILFQLVGVGFALLSLTLLSGLWFVHDWMAQHLAHKTVLSITAWLVFGALLWGRLRHGWRGRVALRWTLSGYLLLVLAYFGSKLVLELFLGTHWGS